MSGSCRANTFTVNILDANGNILPYGTVTRTIQPILPTT